MSKFKTGEKVSINYKGVQVVGEVTNPNNPYGVSVKVSPIEIRTFLAHEIERVLTFQPGDIVRAEKGYRALEDQIVDYNGDSGLLLGNKTLDEYEQDGYTLTLVKRPEPEIVLPTKPGWYLGKYDTPSGYITIELLNTGEWVDNTDSRYLKEDWVKALGKLTRLEPVNE